jgi:hypothetical protein
VGQSVVVEPGSVASVSPDPADQGFWELAERHSPSEAERSLLPLTCDRWEEAFHFLGLVRSLQPGDSEIQRANWYAGAHIGAVVGLRECVEKDFKAVEKQGWKRSSLHRETYLTTDNIDPLDRDPLGVNRAYYDLRTLYVHFGEPLLTADRRTLVVDMVRQDAEVPVRWFLRSLKDPSVGEFRDPRLTVDERDRFNEHCRTRTFVSLASQQLSVLAKALEDTYEAM